MTHHPTQALRNRRQRRERILKVTLSVEEYEFLIKTAHVQDLHCGTWARDTLISRALRLRDQRFLIR